MRYKCQEILASIDDIEYIEEQDKLVGSQRMITQFLLFPKFIDNEYRWLERTSFIQEYTKHEYDNGECLYWWVNEKWKD